MHNLSKIGASVMLLISANLPFSSQEAVIPVKTPQPAPLAVEVIKPLTKLDIHTLIAETAQQYSVSRETMEAIINCESGTTFDPYIQSRHYRNGKREESYGLVQINLPSWPEITMAQATDPVFSIDFLGKKLSEGKGRLWTCYSMLLESGTIRE